MILTPSYIGTICDCDQSDGITFNSRILAKILVNLIAKIGPPYLKSSGANPSGPSALLDFGLTKTFRTSAKFVGPTSMFHSLCLGMVDARTACINYEAVNELDIQSLKISNTLLSRPDELQSQGHSNLRSFNGESDSRVNMKGVSTRDYKANHKGEMKFGKCISCGKFHARNPCV
ncbi:unnamed protein product [Schistosoma curassoni]|uniref:Protein kinase domain-containing protein n=1 Tax=Schistosoma curassoni TaxID=6186 RepID=A0A183L0K3_9TREM|nr:unnamed protein product [Schistosoma curassoni]